MKKSRMSCISAWILTVALLLTMIPTGFAYAEGTDLTGDSTLTSVAESVYTDNVVFDEDCTSFTVMASKGWNVTDAASGIYITDSENSAGNPEGVIKQTTPQGNVLFFADETASKDSGVSALKFPLVGENQLQYKLTEEGKWYTEFSAKFDSLMKIGTYPAESGFSTFIDTGAKTYRITFSPDNKIRIRNGAYGKYAEKTVNLHIGDGIYHNWAISHQGNGLISIVCDGIQVAFFTGINVDASVGSWGAYGVQFINASIGAVSGINKVFFDRVKFVINETAVGAVGDNSLIFNDDCSNLIDAGWAVTEPKPGVFINDGANSVNNPNNIQMPQVPAGEYMLYADGTITNNDFTKMEKLVNIGPDAWELQFDAIFKDLITPSANNIYRGVSFEVFANGLEYKVTFNDKDKVMVMTNSSSGAYLQKQVAMPTDNAFHKWAIAYNGINKIYVKMDDVVVATFGEIAVGATTIPDKVVLVNASPNWTKGTNEVYIDNLKMIRTEASEQDPNILFNDDCSNLKEAGWSGIAEREGSYITDNSNSFGTVAGMKGTPIGQYLIYGYNKAYYTQMAKAVNIGVAPWVLEFDARFVDLMTPSANKNARGFQVDTFFNKKRLTLTFNDKNKLYIGNSTTPIELPMPEDDKFHTWGIAYAGVDATGKAKIFVSIDGEKVAAVVGGTVTSTLADTVYFKVLPLNWVSGETEVYIDNIKMVKNNLPDWTKFDTKINGCTIMPDSDSEQLNLMVSTYDVDPEWFKDENVTVQATVYKDNQELSSVYTRLDKPLVSLILNPQGNTGRMKIVLKLMDGITKVDEITKNFEADADVVFVEPLQEIKTEADKTYIFDRMNELMTEDGRDAISAGWRKSQYSYEGTGNVYTVVESVYNSQELIVPVKAKGWFGVYVGYVSGTQEFIVSDGDTEKTLVIEKEDSQVTNVEVDQYGNKLICETFAFAANFKGNEIRIGQSENRNARIAYIKLKSLSPEEVALYVKANEGAKGNRVVYNNDGYSDFYMGYYANTDKLKELVVDRYAGQDVGEFDWTLGTTLMLNYDSEYAGVPYQGLTLEQEQTLMRDGDKQARDSILGFINAGINPGEVIAQRADELGMNTNISLRMSAFYDMAIYPWLNGSLYTSFASGTTDYRYISKDGIKQSRLSYAYPKFREYIKNVLKEAASFKGVDGVNLDFCRYPDVIGYEPILTDAYKAKYGVDPKSETTQEGLNRWSQFKADVMTAFLRELRSELDGKNISVRIPYKDYFQNGLDVQKWVNDGLIDVLIPSCISYEDFYDITPFADMVKGSNVKLYGGINADLAGHDLTKQEEDLIKRGVPVNRDSKSLNTQQYRLRALELYNAGCEKIYIFNNWKGYQSLGLLGDSVELEKWYGLAYPAEWVENPITIKAPVSEYLSSIKVGSKTVADFVYDRTEYVVTLAYGTVNVPEVSVGTIDPKAKVIITNSTTLADTTTISVTSSDGSKTKEYKVSFRVEAQPEDETDDSGSVPSQPKPDKEDKFVVKQTPIDVLTKNNSLSTPIVIEVQSNGKVIEVIEQKIKIEVELNIAPQNPDYLAVFKINDNGEEELVPARYNESKNTVTFFISSPGKYYAAEYIKNFIDVEDSKWYSKYVKAAAAKGAINGYPDGSYKPEEQITRAEFAAMVVKTFGIEYSSQEVSKFNDVSKNDWSYNFIAALFNNGIINGKSESSFAPNEYISREEMAVLIVKTMIKLGMIDKLQDAETQDFNDASSISNWAGSYVSTALKEGLIKGTGDGSFEPSRGITRAETAVVITNALKK